MHYTYYSLHKFTCNDDLDDGSTDSESDTSDDYPSDMLTEEIVTDDFDFEITDI